MGVGTMSEQSFTVEAPGEFQEERRSMELRWSKDGRLQQRVLVLMDFLGRQSMVEVGVESIIRRGFDR